MRGTDADVKIRGNAIVIRHHYDEPEGIHVPGILKVDVSRPLFGSDGVIRFVISDPTGRLLTAVAGASQPDVHTVYVPFDVVTGDSILVNTKGGDDGLAVDDSLGAFAR